jgi:hypothetical protein
MDGGYLNFQLHTLGVLRHPLTVDLGATIPICTRMAAGIVAEVCDIKHVLRQIDPDWFNICAGRSLLSNDTIARLTNNEDSVK